MKTYEETIALIVGRQVAARLSGVQNIWDDSCLWLIAEIYEVSTASIMTDINTAREEILSDRIQR